MMWTGACFRACLLAECASCNAAPWSAWICNAAALRCPKTHKSKLSSVSASSIISKCRLITLRLSLRLDLWCRRHGIRLSLSDALLCFALELLRRLLLLLCRLCGRIELGSSSRRLLEVSPLRGILSRLVRCGCLGSEGRRGPAAPAAPSCATLPAVMVEVTLLAERIAAVLDTHSASVRRLQDCTLLGLMHGHGIDNVIILHEARDATSAAVELNLSETRLRPKDAAQLHFIRPVTKVADEQCVAWWVILRVDSRV
mmetsp:Transcript_2772/g.8158  ORF Transcript_2772/g.8158 Transcript_2772/m.8158 type:complete len:257 (-) Transcript_2772:772-1542(-)